jgi:hypothetical protein
VRPISSENNRSIDAQNGQAYHGQQSATTYGARPEVLGSRAAEERAARRSWRRRIAPRVRSRAGAAGRTRVLFRLRQGYGATGL